MPNNIIRDGHTRKAHLIGEDKQFDWITFEYRPMLGEDFATIENAVELAETPRKGVHIGCASICKQLVSWSEVDDNGAEVPINLENMRRLPWVLRARIYAVICGIKPTDPIPADDHKDLVQELLYEAEGQSPGQVAEDDTAKN